MKFIGAHIFDYDATFRGDVTIEGNLTISNSVSQTISFGNNDKLKFGDNGEFEIYHDGTNSYINNTNNGGHLFIQTDQTDKDVVLKSDDGSGGMTAYITLDGSESYVKFNKDAVFVDDEKAKFGTGLDLEIYHDGSNSYINQRNTGDLIIQASSDDKDIIFKSDDGSGGVTEYLRFDGGDVKTYVSKDMKFNDSVYATFGNNDLLIGHDGTNSRIYNYTGNLQITNLTDDADIVFQCDDGSGGLATYFRLDGSLGASAFEADVYFYGATSGRYMLWDESQDRLEFVDSVSAVFGSGADLQIMHNGTNTLVDNITGDLSIRQFTDDGDIIFICDDGSGGTTAYLTLDGGLGFTQAQKKIRFKDSVEAEFGDQGDFLIKHTGSHADLTNGTGDIRITNNTDDADILLKTDNGSGGVTTYIQLDGSDLSTKILTQKLIISNLPTSDPGVDGQVWNNSGVLNISSG